MANKKTRTEKFDKAILMFIDAFLIVNGEIKRSDLIDTFGIKLSKSSALLKVYSDNRPSNMRYSNAKKRYIKGSVFTADHLVKLSALQYLDAVDLLFKKLDSEGDKQ